MKCRAYSSWIEKISRNIKPVASGGLMRHQTPCLKGFGSSGLSSAPPPTPAPNIHHLATPLFWVFGVRKTTNYNYSTGNENLPEMGHAFLSIGSLIDHYLKGSRKVATIWTTPVFLYSLVY